VILGDTFITFEKVQPRTGVNGTKKTCYGKGWTSIWLIAYFRELRNKNCILMRPETY